METILIKYHNQELEHLKKIEKGDWIDLRAAEHVVLKAGESKLISLGVSMKLPIGQIDIPFNSSSTPRS